MSKIIRNSLNGLEVPKKDIIDKIQNEEKDMTPNEIDNYLQSNYLNVEEWKKANRDDR